MLKRNLIWLSFIAILLHTPAAHTTGFTAAKSVTISTGRAAGVQEVKLFLIAVDDAGRSGKKIGCNDSVVAITRELRPTRTPLRAALEELLRLPRRYGSN